MKVCLFGVPGITPGTHNVKDPRLDEADRLVEAKKKTYVQVEVAGENDVATSDAMIVTAESRFDLILKDLEFVETRLERNPPEAEKSALLKLKAALESERLVSEAGLTPEEMQTLSVHAFSSLKPVVVATPEDLQNFSVFLARAVTESGYISFLTVGGKENRAWLVKRGTTALEAAGSIHTDMMKGFIRAEIIGYDDFIQAGGETEAKRAGKQRLETKTYVMQDCDLVNFRFNK